MLKLHGKFTEDDTSCGTDTDERDARIVSEKLGIPFHTYNSEDKFEREVIARFVDSYQRGITPNPCVECNRHMKFGALFEHAKELGCDMIVTGHYARIEHSEKYGRKVLKKAVDESKDQSYVLYSLSADQLEHIHLPLGEFTKSEIREKAADIGLSVSDKKESQDICFVPDGNYIGFIERYTGVQFEQGNFIDTDGNVLGKHKGIIRYTVGQHKKLGIVTPEPMYVDRIIPETNEILLVCDDALYKREVRVADVRWSAFDTPPENFSAEAKLRYRHKASPCEVTVNEDGTLTLLFNEPQRAPARGQSAVIYDGDILLGGGVIV
jgi:tRNA-specific 2-thiouridylase